MVERAAKRSYGKAHAWHKQGINILHLQGTLSEMAAQHGALLRHQIHQGAVPYLGTKNDLLMTHSHLFRNRPRLQAAARKFIRWFIDKPMLSQIPRIYSDEMRAFAKAAHLPVDLCEKSVLQADSLVLLLRYFMGRYLLRQTAGGFPGCTSVVALNNTTKNKKLIHARNMDYPVVGRWDSFPSIFYFDPEGVDRGQRYIGISSAGVHTAGVTGINESGLTLTAHFHCAKAVSPFGVPIQIIGSEVIRKARTIGQAVDIVNDLNRAGTWSLVVSSAKENNAVVIEMIHGRISVREPKDGKLAHTNHFHTPEFQQREIMLSTSVAKDYAERYKRAMDLLTKNEGSVDRGTLAQILADHYDRETQKIRGHGNTISVITTVTSIISEATEGRFWMSNATESPTCLGDYAAFKIDEDFKNYDQQEPELFRWSAEGSGSIRDTVKHGALRHFRRAYIAYHTEYDLAEAAKHSEVAAQTDAEEGHYHLAHGHFRMRLGQVERAFEAFRKAQTCSMSPHMTQVSKLFFAHAYDCLGKRQEALELYRQIRNAVDPQVRREAARCIRRPFKVDRTWNITFDLQFCDCFEYA
ncbi:MAG: C45 family peptidase [Bdellovibrionota bacterium]